MVHVGIGTPTSNYDILKNENVTITLKPHNILLIVVGMIVTSSLVMIVRSWC